MSVISAEELDALRAQQAADREKVAAFMIRVGLATGHGDTIDSLLTEAEWQIERLNNRLTDLTRIAKYVGVCMSCIHGAPDPQGCTDCLGTGWDRGEDPIKALIEARKHEMLLAESIKKMNPSKREIKTNPIYVDFLRELFSYDRQTGVLSFKTRSGHNQVEVGDIAGCETSRGYICVSYKKHRFLAHQVIWVLMTGEWPSKTVDHIDGDGLNNSWANLRLASLSQNQCNKAVQKNSKSGVKGVHWSKANKGWVAAIAKGGVRKHIGTFPTIEAASKAYADEAAILHGDFRRAAVESAAIAALTERETG